jgi:hypothetical protein
MPMTTTTLTEKARNLLFLSTPNLWGVWPFLPLVRRRAGQDEEYGVLYDALHADNTPGFSATVFLANLFALPSTEQELLALPREVFDSAEEIFTAGWRVD